VFVNFYVHVYFMRYIGLMHVMRVDMIGLGFIFVDLEAMRYIEPIQVISARITCINPI